MTSISVRQAVSPAEACTLDTEGLRKSFLVTGLFASGAVNMTYSHLDRMVLGGAVPDGKTLKLESAKTIGSDPFLKRREIGIFNIGSGPGAVTADGEAYALQPADCLYLPMGTTDVAFADDGGDARFYFISTPAHHRTEARVIRKAEANKLDLGTQADSNVRALRQYIHPDICKSCQLVMGMTLLAEGSIWNTMPCHTHDRRSEAYLYFDMAPEVRVFHFMGEPQETRHLVIANEEAVLSPGWSIHCGAGTARYGFIWAMAGDNQDFGDMDMVATEALR